MGRVQNSVCVLATAFPVPKNYLVDFFDSFLNQDYTHFDIIMVNDGNNDLDEFLGKYNKLSIATITPGETPLVNRIRLIKEAINRNYKYVVFSDIDDKFSYNRVFECVRYLEENDIVVNDITTFNSKGILQRKYLSKRIVNGQRISFKDIETSNIMGLSNTAVKVDLLKELDLDFPEDVIALDWLIYSLLMLKGYKAKFISSCETFYRQHENNTVGMGIVTKESIASTVKVKEIHFRTLCDHYEKASSLKNEMIAISKDPKKIRELYSNLKNKTIYPLWWEL
ncbi:MULTISPECIES: glycosyltransferase [Vibrio]|uniref:glycosyltransferase n=1 Tax=Vibrio TaxID=662 RepID=UPI0021C44ADC|nr:MULTISPECIES: glycosyltransferase [Vibrio]MDE1319354.1 glycosyltransferase [Vibrio aestuarianus]MDF9399680.1 glycosyltransferase [Vibrio sp. 1180_3]CAH8242012.1 putative Glyco_trans_2-like domain-containing protein [Vibrio aestuarianus]